jgi:hypothetical protein
MQPDLGDLGAVDGRHAGDGSDGVSDEKTADDDCVNAVLIV